MTHHFTVDVEEYFHVSAFEGLVPRTRWDRMESRVAPATRALSALLSEHGVRATMFVLGWVAERHPDLVRELAADGHEIASHGYAHRRVTTLTPDEFRASVRRTRVLLEDLTGEPVLGFRAPSFSITPGCEWALDVLVEEGYRYDSSLYPVRRRGYGFPDGQRDPHWRRCRGAELAEVPPATLDFAGRIVAAGGGAYFRVLPTALVHAALDQAERRGAPATFYIHPWELDVEQPRLDVGLSTRLRHYTGLRGVRERLHQLLSRYRFQPIADTLFPARSLVTAS